MRLRLVVFSRSCYFATGRHWLGILLDLACHNTLLALTSYPPASHHVSSNRPTGIKGLMIVHQVPGVGRSRRKQVFNLRRISRLTPRLLTLYGHTDSKGDVLSQTRLGRFTGPGPSWPRAAPPTIDTTAIVCCRCPETPAITIWNSARSTKTLDPWRTLGPRAGDHLLSCYLSKGGSVPRELMFHGQPSHELGLRAARPMVGGDDPMHYDSDNKLGLLITTVV